MSLPLPELTFYRMPDASPAGTAIKDLLDAIYTSLSSATDYRGTSLASTHLWTIRRYQNAGTTEAVYTDATPTGTPMGKTPRIIFAGKIANAGTMASPDTSVASVLQVSINKNSGAYNAWDNAAPFTSGNFFGYWKCAKTAANATTTIVRSYVSQESFFIQIIEPVVTSQSWIYAGAIVEPFDADTVYSGETDNRLYGLAVNGGTNNNSATWTSANSSSAFLSHGTTNGESHCGIFAPNAGTLIVGGKGSISSSVAHVDELQTPSGLYIGDIVTFKKSTANLVNNGTRFGTFRGLYLAGSIQSGRWLRNGSTDLYHYVSTNAATAAPGLMLPAAP